MWEAQTTPEPSAIHKERQRVWGCWGSVLQDSCVGLGARKLEILGGPQDPEPSSFNAEREGRGLNSHLGPGWAGDLGGQGKRSLFPFPRVAIRDRVGQGGAKGLSSRSHFLFPTVWSHVTPTTSHPLHTFLALGKPCLGCSGRKRLQEPKPLTVLPTLLCRKRGKAEKGSQRQGSFSPQGSHPNPRLV